MKQAILRIGNARTNNVQEDSQDITKENHEQERTDAILAAKRLLDIVNESLAPYENEYIIHDSEEKNKLKVNRIEQNKNNKNKTTITSVKPIKVVENIYYLK
jgi:hypothetical protein